MLFQYFYRAVVVLSQFSFSGKKINVFSILNNFKKFSTIAYNSVPRFLQFYL